FRATRRELRVLIDHCIAMIRRLAATREIAGAERGGRFILRSRPGRPTDRPRNWVQLDQCRQTSIVNSTNPFPNNSRMFSPDLGTKPIRLELYHTELHIHEIRAGPSG